MIEHSIGCGPVSIPLYPVSTVSSSQTYLCLHGFTGSGKDFEFLQSELADEYELWAIDWPGHGKSQCPLTLDYYQLPYLADLLKKCICRLSETSDFKGIIAYSMGSRLLKWLAHYDKDFYTAFNWILLSPSPGLDAAKDRQLRRERDLQLSRFLEEKGLNAFCDHWESSALIKSQITQKEGKRVKHIVERRRQNSIMGLSLSLTAFSPGRIPFIEPASNPLPNGSTIICGESDTKYVEFMKQFSQHNKNLRTEIINNCGHAPHLESPHKTADIIRSQDLINRAL